MDSSFFHRSTMSLQSPRLSSATPVSPSIYSTPLGNHPCLDTGSAPEPLLRLLSQEIGLITSKSYTPQPHSIRQYQAFSQNPLQESETRNEQEHQQACAPLSHLQAHTTRVRPSGDVLPGGRWSLEVSAQVKGWYWAGSELGSGIGRNWVIHFFLSLSCFISLSYLSFINMETG